MITGLLILIKNIFGCIGAELGLGNIVLFICGLFDPIALIIEKILNE